MLVYGEFHLLMEDDPNFFVYERFDENSKMLVVLNFSDQKRSLTLGTQGATGLACLISNYNSQIDSQGSTLHLRPWEGNIYKVETNEYRHKSIMGD